MFEVHGVHARAQSHVEGIAFTPYVYDKDRLKWEQEYSIGHQQQIIESQMVSLRKDTTLHSSTYLEGDIAPSIFTSDLEGNVFPSPPSEVS
jgi:hypothetical protein